MNNKEAVTLEDVTPFLKENGFKKDNKIHSIDFFRHKSGVEVVHIEGVFMIEKENDENNISFIRFQPYLKKDFEAAIKFALNP